MLTKDQSKIITELYRFLMNLLQTVFSRFHGLPLVLEN